MSKNDEGVLDELINHPDFKRWENIDQDIIFCLFKANVPINIMRYISQMSCRKIERGDFEPFDILHPLPGIILNQIRYQSRKDDWHTKTEWYTWKNREILSEASAIIGKCIWMLRPLNIFCRNREGIPASKMLVYSYKIGVEKTDLNNKKCVRYSAFIQTDLNGNVLKKVYSRGDEKEDFPIRFVFPKQVVSQINRCLCSNFWSEFWVGPPFAMWYCTDRGIAHYLGHIKCLDECDKTQDFTKLINGPNGDAALILLAYTCFSVLKPFFPSYPSLQQNAKYLDAKKNIPKQIAINVRSNSGNDAEKLVDICCGYFQKFTSNKKNAVAITDGIKIQMASRKLSQLGINEFESKVIQPASILWIDRNPHFELIQSGKILDICLAPQTGEDITRNLDHCISERLVNTLTGAIQEATENLSANPNESKWLIGVEWLDRVNITRKKPGIRQYSLESAYKKRLALLSKHSRRLRSKYIPAGESNYHMLVSGESQTEIETDLDESIINKVAYLSASFHIFAQAAIPEENQCRMICEKAESAILAAFKSQTQGRKPNDIKDALEIYILETLKSGHCARIRGECSEREDIRLWYDPKEKVFLLTANEFFNNLRQRTRHTPNISEDEVLALLIQAKILCTKQCKNQIRGTFDVVVQRGTHSRLSVRKINMEALSKHFIRDAREWLERMENDKTPYRS